MANKAISELPQAQNVNNQDLFVLEQSGIAKKLTAETFITEQGIIDALAEALDGHGGIQSVTLSSVSGRIRTYRITFTDQSATTFQVYDGTSIDRISRTSSSGLDDVYTIFLSDGTTTFFTVHNGADGNVSEAMLNDALKDKAPAVTETTESSAIATFTDGADDMAMYNVVAEINPVQDLTYGDPYPAGGGKNLYSILIGADTFQINAGATFSNVDGTLKIEMAAANGSGVYATSFSVIKPLIMSLSGEYTLSFDIKASQSGAVICGAESLTSTPITATTSWQRFSLTSTYATPNTTFICYNRSGNAMTVEVKNLQICLSSATDPTVYSPYSNICPISGWTGVNVTRTGKNLFDPNSQEKEWVSWNGTLTTDTNAKSNRISAKNGDVFTLSNANATSDTCLLLLAFLDSDDKVIGSRHIEYQGAKYVTATAPENTVAVLAAITRWPNSDKQQLELGSTATTYEPYITPSTVSLSWQTEAGTVYGGTIDVATGLLTVDRAIVTLGGGLQWQTWGVNNRTQGITGFYLYRSANSSVDYSNYRLATLTNMLPINSLIWGGDAVGYYSNLQASAERDWYEMLGVPNDSVGIVDTDTNEQALSKFNAFLTATPLQVVHMLATPQTYQLSGQQLMALLGTNNVWADTGNVSVTYPADTKLYIEKLTMPTEDDLVANQAITSGKYFMIGNSLYLALANIASGAQITIGTNAQRVSLADALNTINS